MPKNKEYELAIKIAGEIEKSFYESTKLTKKELQDMAKQAAKAAEASSGIPASLRSKFQSGLIEAKPFFTGLEDMARTSFKAIAGAASAAGLGITTGLGLAVSVGSEFESAFAGVKKTVDASDEEFRQMRDDIRQMAQEMPTTAAELSAIAESAGQLGIENKNIIEFTKTMADMAVATNLTSDEAATDFAKFANITGMAQDKFDELGSSVVALGNNLATNEADIVSMGMRIAAAGDQIGLSQAQIMGYSAALSSVGMEAEAGGSSFSKMFVKLQMATETGKGLKDYAKVAGMTGAEFKEVFKTDTTKAINAFISGLNDTERNGKSAIAVLNDMGLTEVNLRDTLIRAANASDLFDNALEISNEAWEENVALANEAAQRYITLESQMGIFGNKIKDIGISFYDDLKPGLTDVMILANDFVDGIAGQEDVFGNVISSAVKDMPTMAREVREAGKAVREFSEPFLKVGGWLVDNPGVIVGAVSSIGASLAGYKVTSSVMSLATSLKNLGGVGIGILGLGGVAGVIAGINTAVKKSAAEAKQANLAAHFGDISLSISELQETAAAMIQSQNLDQLQESMVAMSEVSAIGDDIRAATRELDKLDWKVSVGMELTESEREEYQRQVESFVASTQEFLAQDQYALSLSVRVLFGDDTENANEIVGQIDDYFTQQQQELESKRLMLNDAVTRANEDNQISSEEAKEIASLREEIAQIQRNLTGNEFESQLDVIEAKYGGKNLNADSVINLFDEVQKQREAQMGTWEENYASVMEGYRSMLSGGGFTQEEYESRVDDTTKAYLQQKADALMVSTQRELDMIRNAYGEEYADMVNEVRMGAGEHLENMLQNIVYAGSPNVHLDLLGENIIDDINVDRATRDAYADLYSPMASALQEFQELQQQIKELGMEIPEMNEIMEEMASVGVISGNENAAWQLLGDIAEADKYQEYFQVIKENGGYMPEVFAEGMEENQQAINFAVQQSYDETREIINQTYGKGFDITAPINLALETVVSTGVNMAGRVIPHKDGGIFDRPHLGLIAEAGYPEAAIPIDGSQNAIDLWKTTGELLGMDGLTGGAEPIADNIENAALSSGFGQNQFVFSPTLQFYGSSPSKEDIEDVLEEKQEEFAQMMEQWMKNNFRTSFR